MKLLVGLGNPGRKHERNRHNIGFMAVDRIAEEHGFGNWRGRFSGLVAEGRMEGSPILLLKPQGYMNNSGQSVGEAMRYFRLSPGDVAVFHDELDLAPGKVRVKSGGGHAGHNGLKSACQHIGPDFVRIRLGIGHPGERHLVTPYVLSDFSRLDREWLPDLISAIAECAPCLAGGDIARLQNCLGQARRQAPQAGSNTDSARRQAQTGSDPGSKPPPQRQEGVFQSLLGKLRDRMSS